jgi:hypothetical protein
VTLRCLRLDAATLAPHLEALLAADHRCYQRAVDRLSRERAELLLEATELRVRLWFDEAGAPCGYTAIHTVPQASLDLLRDPPPSAPDRSFVTPAKAGELAAGVYLFNYSIAPELRRSAASRALLAGLADDLAAMPQSLPVAALCVSAEGVRVAERFGLRDHARIEVGGDLETVMLR